MVLVYFNKLKNNKYNFSFVFNWMNASYQSCKLYLGVAKCCCHNKHFCLKLVAISCVEMTRLAFCINFIALRDDANFSDNHTLQLLLSAWCTLIKHKSNLRKMTENDGIWKILFNQGFMAYFIVCDLICNLCTFVSVRRIMMIYFP